MSKSKLELEFEFQWRFLCMHYPLEKEYQFAKEIGRNWRADFAYPPSKILIEMEGGIWRGGRHTRGVGYEKDCEKYNTATLLGWKVFRFTKVDPDWILAIREFIQGVIK